MPKQVIQLTDLNFNIGTASSGTYTIITNLSIDQYGRISQVTTSSVAPGLVPGAVISLAAASDRITVSTSTGYPTVDLGYVGTTGTWTNIQSVTIDTYGRIVSVTTATTVLPSGSYPYPQSITVDISGRLTAITTATGFSGNAPALNVPSGNHYFQSTLNIQQLVETINTTPTSTTVHWPAYPTVGGLSTSTTKYTLDCSTSTVHYITPTDNFCFAFIPASMLTNVNSVLGTTNPSLTVTVIVNNTGGYIFRNNSGNLPSGAGGLIIGSGGGMGWFGTALSPNYNSGNLIWPGGIIPKGVAGRIEIYSFTLFPGVAVAGSMITYG